MCCPFNYRPRLWKSYAALFGQESHHGFEIGKRNLGVAFSRPDKDNVHHGPRNFAAIDFRNNIIKKFLLLRQESSKPKIELIPQLDLVEGHHVFGFVEIGALRMNRLSCG